MTSTDHPSDAKGGLAGAVGAGAHPGTPGTTARPPPETNRQQTRNQAPTQSVTGPQER
jgi:hypothetical protein